MAPRGVMALSVGAVLVSCALDWDLPVGGSGGGGGSGGASTAAGSSGHGGATTADTTSTVAGTGGGDAGGGTDLPFDALCCRVCTPAPAACPEDARLRFDTHGDCSGWYWEGGTCRLIESCACDNCEPLPDNEVDCGIFVHTMCNDCVFD